MTQNPLLREGRTATRPLGTSASLLSKGQESPPPAVSRGLSDVRPTHLERGEDKPALRPFGSEHRAKRFNNARIQTEFSDQIRPESDKKSIKKEDA